MSRPSITWIDLLAVAALLGLAGSMIGAAVTGGQAITPVQSETTP